MRRQLHAEWTKLRTVTGTGLLLLALVALTVSVSLAAVSVVTCPSAGCGFDAPRISLFGVQVGQAIVATLAVLAVTGEYSTGMIRTTLTAMHRRTDVLAAKALLLAGLTAAAGTVAVLGSFLAGRLIMPGNGFTAAHGYAALSLADGPTLRAVVGSVLYLVLIALLSLGVAVAVRDSAVAVGVVLGLLYLLPALIFMVRSDAWQKALWVISPTNSGLAVQATTRLAELPLSPWAGLGVTAAWAAGALMVGGLVLRARDA